MKRFISLFIALCLAFSLCACGGQAQSGAPAENAAPAQNDAAAQTGVEGTEEVRVFTDDCGREVELPKELKSVAVSGPLAQMYVLPVCPELMAGFASQFSENIEKYVKPEYLNLPVLGQLYGGKGTLDPEMLISVSPDVVIDVGEQKGNIVEDLDGLTEQTGIPFVHIDATLTTSAQTFRRLGELTGKTEKAEELAVYIDNALAVLTDIMARVDADGKRETVLYCLGDKGQNVLAEQSFHAEAINIVSQNVADIEDASPSGLGNEVDMEQLILWNPGYIIFAPDCAYEEFIGDETWQQLDAVKNGNVYKTPAAPYGWAASLPSVQRYLGMLWLADLFYPEYCDYNLEEQVTEYYRLFYDYDLTAAEYAELTADSLR